MSDQKCPKCGSKSVSAMLLCRIGDKLRKPVYSCDKCEYMWDRKVRNTNE